MIEKRMIAISARIRKVDESIDLLPRYSDKLPPEYLRTLTSFERELKGLLRLLGAQPFHRRQAKDEDCLSFSFSPFNSAYFKKEPSAYQDDLIRDGNLLGSLEFGFSHVDIEEGEKASITGWYENKSNYAPIDIYTEIDNWRKVLLEFFDLEELKNR